MEILEKNYIKTSKYKNKKGISLLTVIFIFTFMTGVLGLIFILFQTNVKQASLQERRIEAEYLALSGVELAMNALLQEVIVGGVNTRLLDRFQNPVPDNISQTIDFENDGTAKITLTREIKDLKPYVKIVSVGTAKQGIKNVVVNAEILMSLENEAIIEYEIY